MRIRPLTRLRIAFLALGVVLLGPLGFLMSAVGERLAAQQRLRHEVVAERIFDELERELTAVLERESARPSSAYDEATQSAAWAPFVVGYFKTGPNGTDLLAGDQLPSERKERLRESIASLVHERDQPTEQALVPSPASKFAPRSSLDVLSKLNRGQEERTKMIKRQSAPSSTSSGDPMLR